MIITNYLEFTAGDYTFKIRVPSANEAGPIVDFFRAYRRRCRAASGDGVDYVEISPTPAEIEAGAAAVRPFIESVEGGETQGFSYDLLLTTLAVQLYNEMFTIPEIKKK